MINLPSIKEVFDSKDSETRLLQNLSSILTCKKCKSTKFTKSSGENSTYYLCANCGNDTFDYEIVETEEN